MKNSLDIFEKNKFDFVNEFYTNVGTQKNSYRVLNLFHEAEIMYNLDLCNISKEVFILLMTSLKTNSPRTLSSIYWIVEKYVTWCIDKGIKTNDINYVSEINLKDNILDKIEWKEILKDTLLTKEEMYEVISEYFLSDIAMCQAAAVIPLLYYGISGNQYEDITHLKAENINFDEGYIITPVSNKKVFVDDKCLDLLSNAMLEEERLKSHGKNQPYLKSDYIFKNIKKSDRDVIDSKRIYEKIKEVFGKDAKVSPRSIIKSGMFDKLNSMKSHVEDFRIEDYGKVMGVLDKSQSAISRLKEDYKFLI